MVGSFLFKLHPIPLIFAMNVIPVLIYLLRNRSSYYCQSCVRDKLLIDLLCRFHDLSYFACDQISI